MTRAARALASLGAVSALTVGAAAATEKARTPLPTHAVQGVVKSVSTFYVAIVAGSGKKARELDFELSPSTERSGELTIGTVVSVRYRIEDHRRLATAVAAHTDGIHAAQQHVARQ